METPIAERMLVTVGATARAVTPTKKTETATTAGNQGTPAAVTLEQAVSTATPGATGTSWGPSNISQDASSRRDVSSSSVANNFIALDVSNVVFLIGLRDQRKNPSASPHCQKLFSA